MKNCREEGHCYHPEISLTCHKKNDADKARIQVCCGCGHVRGSWL